MPLATFLALLQPVDDVYEETHSLFSARTAASARNLGFVSRTAPALALSVGAADYTIHQSPALLNARRAGGTTGAVLWRVTPALASWLARADNPLFAHAVLGADARVLELGAGVSSVLALTLGPRVARYWLSDQEYVLKLAQKNLDENLGEALKSRSRPKPTSRSASRKSPARADAKIEVVEVDWEETSLPHHLAFRDDGLRPLHLVLAADCIYNEALIVPFVDTCVDACKLNREVEDSGTPTVVVVAQELRSSDVFEAWLEAFAEKFEVWRVPEGVAGRELGPEEGIAVHVGVLKGDEST